MELNQFNYVAEKFDDTQILRYHIPGFEDLSHNQKLLIYYLHEAALVGRDIFWDQNYKHNLVIRKILEEIIIYYTGNKENPEYKHFIDYSKKVFVSNGIHHHYSSRKIIPGFSSQYLELLMNNSPDAFFSSNTPEQQALLLEWLIPVMFDPNVDPVKVSSNASEDIIQTSAVNFYENVSQEEATEYYTKLADSTGTNPLSWGLNTKLIKRDEVLIEIPWTATGMYGPAIQQIVKNLRNAITFADNPTQQKVISRLIDFFETGDLQLFDTYSILWVHDTVSMVDFTNGFIEVYHDPLGLKGAYQSMVYIIDQQADQRVKKIASLANWFETNMPFDSQWKKEKVTGISARAVNMVAASGDNSPTPPLGVNLPNSDWIRREFGSKSITISNIAEAYHNANIKSGIAGEFYIREADRELAASYGFISNNLHTDLHEIIGHGSGKLNPGVADMSITLKNYASVIEETRADLAALYFIADPKLVSDGISPSPDVAKAQYNHYITNGLMLQLNRIEPGDDLQQTHMRNRQLIARKALEMGTPENVIEQILQDGKTYFVINDYEKLRAIFGQLLHEIQRIKSEGDFEAAKNLVEGYGVKIDQNLHTEVKSRYARLGVAPFTAFINPVFVPVYRHDRIVDIKVEYPEDFLDQMMDYGERYSFLEPKLDPENPQYPR